MPDKPKVPREKFVFVYGEHDAYDDRPIPLVREYEGRTFTFHRCVPTDTYPRNGRYVVEYDVSRAFVTWSDPNAR